MNAFVFVPALVACVLIGFLFALYAAHYYLTVLQSTGSGARRVDWVSEPLVDIFWKVFYLGWLIGLWLGPALLLGRTFSKSADQPWMRYAVPLAVFWVCYPLSQLSSLSGPSIWLPLHHDVFGRLARKPGVVIGFAILSGLTLTALGLGFQWSFQAEGFAVLIPGCLCFVIAGLIYARLLGRLAFSLMFTRSVLSRKKKKRKPAEKPTVHAPVPDEGPAFLQPSELPPIQTPDEGDLSGYEVKFDESPRKRVKAQSVAEPDREPRTRQQRPWDEDEGEAYAVHEPEVVQEDRAPAEIVKPSAIEMKLLSREDAPKQPKQVWSLALLEFLVQPGTLAAIGVLTTLCVLLGTLIRLAREFNPVRGE